jgi:hypothetical protein
VWLAQRTRADGSADARPALRRRSAPHNSTALQAALPARTPRGPKRHRRDTITQDVERLPHGAADER